MELAKRSGLVTPSPDPPDGPSADSAGEHRDLDSLAHEFAAPEEVRSVQRGYLRLFIGCDRVLDVGCGRGLFLDLLREARIGCVGVDASEAAVASCRERDHDAIAGDATRALRGLADAGERFGGIFLSHVVEHMLPPQTGILLGEAARVVAPGGRLVVVTPNVKNLLVLTEVFWLDPTHVRPYPRRLIELLGAAAGLQVVESFDDPATVPRRPFLRRLLARIRSALAGADRSGPMDSVVVFTRR